MDTQKFPQEDVSSSEETAIRTLYHQLLSAWNAHDADEFAGLFAEDGNVVGFDGSPLNGRAEVRSELQRIFKDHLTSRYVAKVREVRFLNPEVALLRAVSGMVPPGKTELNPAVNAIQTLIAVRVGGQWYIALFQITPAQFHGRQEESDKLTEELKQLLG